MGVPQNIMRAHCTTIRLDHFKFASYGPVVECSIVKLGQVDQSRDMVEGSRDMYSQVEPW